MFTRGHGHWTPHALIAEARATPTVSGMTDLPLDIDSLMTHAADIARAEMATRPLISNRDEESQFEKSCRNTILVSHLVELIAAGREPDTAVRVLRARDRT